MDYEIYHDETKVKGFWHGILFVPTNTKITLCDLLQKARFNTKFENFLSLKDVRKGKGNRYNCAKSWASIGTAALMNRTRISYPHHIYLGNHNYKSTEYQLFKDPIKAKLIVFRDRDEFTNMQYAKDSGSKVEMSFRIGLKGGVHFLGRDPDEYIRITKIHFDGYEHIKRHFNYDRIVARLREGLRDYCDISNDINIIDDRPSKYSNNNSRNYEDCELLQLTDILLGSFRSLLSDTTNSHHARIVSFAKPIIQRFRSGYAAMQNSRWKNSFWMSQSYIENGKWKFEPIEISEENQAQQIPFPFDK